VAQGVQVGWLPTSGGRYATGGRYRGRHRKPRAQTRLRTGIRVAVTTACAARLVCLPQPSWADRAGTVATHTAVTSHVTVRSLPSPVRQKRRD